MPVDPQSTTVISALCNVPVNARGMVRDLRVRWALEEIDRPYRSELLDGIMNPRSDAYRQWQPFGQVPAFAEGDIRLFESGAILLYLGEHDERLLSTEPKVRAETISWLFAALNTIEPLLVQMEFLDVFQVSKASADEAREPMVKFADLRLKRLAEILETKRWLSGEFSIADIAMGNVLHRAGKMITGYPVLADYRARGEARPAYQQALADHISDLGKPNNQGEAQ